MRMAKHVSGLLTLAAMILATQATAVPFTYQGRLTDNGLAPTGVYDIQLRLMTAVSGGTQLGSLLTFNDVSVVGGLFTVNPDFGSSVNLGVQGQALEIRVRPGASTGSYTILSPRRALSPSPSANTVYNRTVIVRPVGTDLQNGTALLGAITSLADTTSTNRSLVWIEPGTYDVGASPIILPQGMSLRGMGQDATTINGSGNASATLGVVRSMGFNHVDGLTIQCFGGGTFNFAIPLSRNGAGELLIRDVRLYSVGAIQECIGFVDNAGGTLAWDRGRIFAEDIMGGHGIQFAAGTARATIRDLFISMNLDAPTGTTVSAIKLRSQTMLDWRGGDVTLQGGFGDGVTLNLISAQSGGEARIREVKAEISSANNILPFDLRTAAIIDVDDCNVETIAEGGDAPVVEVFHLESGSRATVNDSIFSEGSLIVASYRGANLLQSACTLTNSRFEALGDAIAMTGLDCWLILGLDSDISVSQCSYKSEGYRYTDGIESDGVHSLRIQDLVMEIQAEEGRGIDMSGEDINIDGLSMDVRARETYYGIQAFATRTDVRNVDMRITELPFSGAFSTEGVFLGGNSCNVEGVSVLVDRESSTTTRQIDVAGFVVGSNFVGRDLRLNSLVQNSASSSTCYGAVQLSPTNTRISDSVFRLSSEGIFSGLSIFDGTMRATNVHASLTAASATATGRGFYLSPGFGTPTLYAKDCVAEFEGTFVARGLFANIAAPSKAYFDGGELGTTTNVGSKTVDGVAATPNIFLSNVRMNSFVSGAYEKHTACIDLNYNPIP